MKSPFFNPDYPASINYGDIGATVGHEFTHGLDDEGRQYDEKGNLHSSLQSWWSQNSVDNFRNRSQCFVDQYSAQKEKVTGLNVSSRMGFVAGS